MPVRSSWSSAFDACLRVAPTAPSGWRNGDGARERPTGSSTRAADATTRLRADDRRERREQLRPVDGLQARRCRLLGEVHVDDHRLTARRRGCSTGAARGARCARRCKRAASRHTASSSVGVDLARVELVERAPGTSLHRERHRAVRERRERIDAPDTAHRRCAPSAASAPRARHRARATTTASRRSDRGAGACGTPRYKQVGVAAVLRVDLDERRATVGRRRAVELRPTAFGALEASGRGGRGRRHRARAATVDGAGRRFGDPNSDRARARPRTRPRRSARISSGTPALPAIAIAHDQHEQREVARHASTQRESHGLPTVVAAAAPATYASDGKRVDATHVPLVTAPATRGCRSSTTSSNASDAGARGAGEHEDPEAPPALLHDEHDARRTPAPRRPRPG